MEVDLNQARESERPPCPDATFSCDAVSLVGAPWSISNGERLVASGRGEPGQMDYWWMRSVGSFESRTGHCVLNLDVLEDQSRLNFYEPHLVIYEAGGKYNSTGALGALSLLALVLCGPLGASMTVLAANHWQQEKLAAWWKTYPLTQAGPVPGRQIAPPIYGKTIAASHQTRSAMPRPFARLSQTSLILVLTLFMIWTAVVVSFCLERVVPTGLRIHVIRPGVIAQRSLGLQPLRVRVATGGRGGRPAIWVDRQGIPWEDLSAFLKKELARRPPDWPVYVEGDPYLEWRQVAEAIDAVRGQQAEVVLLPGAAKSQ
jgi:hypothetical protein